MHSDENKLLVQLKIIGDMEVDMSLKLLKDDDKPGLTGIEVHRVGKVNDIISRTLTER